MAGNKGSKSRGCFYSFELYVYSMLEVPNKKNGYSYT